MREPDVLGILFSGLKGDERTKLKESYKGIKVILDPTLRRVLDHYIAESLLKTESPKTYDKPAWAEFQADQLGYRRALREVLALLP